MIYNGKKKKVCIKQYICTNLFLCFFGKGDEQLALDADSVVCRKEEGGPRPPSSLFGTLLCRRGRVKKKKKG